MHIIHLLPSTPLTIIYHHRGDMESIGYSVGALLLTMQLGDRTTQSSHFSSPQWGPWRHGQSSKCITSLYTPSAHVSWPCLIHSSNQTSAGTYCWGQDEGAKTKRRNEKDPYTSFSKCLGMKRGRLYEQIWQLRWKGGNPGRPVSGATLGGKSHWTRRKAE